MKPQRILALVPEGHEPPASIEGYEEHELQDWKMEYDVITALRHRAHDVRVLSVTSNLGLIREIVNDWKPDIAFNMLEDFHGVPVYDHHLAGYLELLRLPYTGCNPRGLMLARDKALAKKLLSYHRIRVPHGVVFEWGRVVRPPKSLSYPRLVKSTVAEASTGISDASVVHTPDELVERVVQLQEAAGSDVMAEEFVPGRELYVGVVGNQRCKTFPIWELIIANLPTDTPNIATESVKFDLEYQDKMGVRTEAATNLPDGAAERIHKLSRRVYKALSLSGYARLDMRMTESGDVYVLEANPNPQLALDEDFARSALAAGMEYEELVEQIVRLGLQFRAGWKHQ
jgi:D-alanine-D-alanine ligase